MKGAAFQAYIRSVLSRGAADSNLGIPDSCILLLDDGLSDLKEYFISKRVLLKCLFNHFKMPLLWRDVKNILMNRLVIVIPGFSSTMNNIYELNFYPRNVEVAAECESFVGDNFMATVPSTYILDNLHSRSIGPLQDSILASPLPEQGFESPFVVQSTPRIPSSLLKRRASSPLEVSEDLFE